MNIVYKSSLNPHRYRYFSTEVCWGSITLLTSCLMLNIWAWKTSPHSLIFLGRLHGHIYNHSVETCSSL